MNHLYRLARRPRAGAIIAFCGSMTFTYTLLISVHTLIGTPHILLTITPGFIPTISFYVLYPLMLLRQARSHVKTGADANMTVDHVRATIVRRSHPNGRAPTRL